MRHWILALSLSLSACEAEPSAYEEPLDDELTLPDDLVLEEAIYFGTNATLTRHKGVVGLVDSQGFLICTGSLVRSNRVLTAAHCADGTSLALILVGSNLIAGPAQAYPVSQVDIHPTWNPNTLQGDLAMLTLGVPVQGVTPLIPATSTHPLRANDVGRTGEAIGYGEDQLGNAGRRMRADIPMIQIDADHVYTDSARSGPCFGDSGGPLMVRIDNALRIAGVASFVIPGAQDCTGDAGYTRLDAYTSWLFQF